MDTTTLQNLITRKTRAAEKIAFFTEIHRRATLSVCHPDAYQDLDERLNMADVTTREIRKLHALIAQLDAEIAQLEQPVEEIAEDAAEEIAPIAEYADVIATRLAGAFSQTSAGAARTRSVLDTLLADAEPAPLTPDEIAERMTPMTPDEIAAIAAAHAANVAIAQRLLYSTDELMTAGVIDLMARFRRAATR